MEADLNLLETARRCELYGVKMHNVKVRVTCEKCVRDMDYEVL